MTLPHECPATGPTAALAAQIQGHVPRIETARLILRAPRIEDFETYAEIACSDRATGIGGPMTRAEAWADFAQVCVTWYLRGHGGWTVVRREGGAPLGFVLIGFEPGDRAPELGFLFTAAAEGQGFAAEAAQAARDHGFGPFALESLVSYIDPANTRSIALAERLGAMRDAEAEAALGPDVVCLVYRHAPGAARC